MYVPAGHACGDELPSHENPAGHAVQASRVLLLLPPLVYEPCLHVEHAAALSLEL